MSLFIDVETGALPDQGESDLFAITLSDGGLGDEPVAGDDTVIQMTYSRTLANATAERIDTLVNTDFGTPIVITPLPSDGPDPSNPGGTIAGNGVTFPDTSSGTEVIRVFYDTGQCNGQGIQVQDTSGNWIATPNPVILYHELSHALHYATGTIAPTSAEEEAAAETDENVLRSELGLPLRDVNNHNGRCGGGPTGNGCLIVTAAYGSETSEQVVQLRRLRDIVLRHSLIGYSVFEQLHREYYVFSPRVSREMREDPALRAAVQAVFVAPLVDFYSLARMYCIETQDAREFAALAREVLIRSRADAELAGIRPALGADIARRIDASDVGPGRLPAWADRVIDYGYARMTAHRSDVGPMVRWALLDAIAAYWRVLALPPGRDLPALRRALEGWVGKLPASYLDEVIPGLDVEHDLDGLRRDVAGNERVMSAVRARYPAAAQFSNAKGQRR